MNPLALDKGVALRRPNSLVQRTFLLLNRYVISAHTNRMNQRYPPGGSYHVDKNLLYNPEPPFPDVSPTRPPYPPRQPRPLSSLLQTAIPSLLQPQVPTQLKTKHIRNTPSQHSSIKASHCSTNSTIPSHLVPVSRSYAPPCLVSTLHLVHYIAPPIPSKRPRHSNIYKSPHIPYPRNPPLSTHIDFPPPTPPPSTLSIATCTPHKHLHMQPTAHASCAKSFGSAGPDLIDGSEMF